MCGLLVREMRSYHHPPRVARLQAAPHQVVVHRCCPLRPRARHPEAHSDHLLQDLPMHPGSLHHCLPQLPVLLVQVHPLGHWDHRGPGLRLETLHQGQDSRHQERLR
eukprot:XP_001710098.1 Hypothetical protein GL50803_19380 [Giardia lamblia ATCC 50803]